MNKHGNMSAPSTPTKPDHSLVHGRAWLQLSRICARQDLAPATAGKRTQRCRLPQWDTCMGVPGNEIRPETDGQVFACILLRGERTCMRLVQGIEGSSHRNHEAPSYEDNDERERLDSPKPVPESETRRTSRTGADAFSCSLRSKRVTGACSMMSNRVVRMPQSLCGLCCFSGGGGGG